MGRAAVGAAGTGALARDLAVRVRVDLAVVMAASVAAMEAEAEVMVQAVVAVAAGGTRSGRVARASVSSSS